MELSTIALNHIRDTQESMQHTKLEYEKTIDGIKYMKQTFNKQQYTDTEYLLKRLLCIDGRVINVVECLEWS